MKKRLLALVLGCALPSCGVGNEPPSQNELIDAWKAELIEADQAFSDAVDQEGLDRWPEFFTDDGAMIQEGTGEIRGTDAIRAAMGAAAGAVTGFSWRPDRAEVSNGGDLGYTVGRYETRVAGPDGEELLSTGLYVSIWRRQEDGRWKVEMDLGNPVAGPSTDSSESEEGGDTEGRP